MSRITLDITLDVPPSVVWEYLAQIERHTEWMADAERIEFRTPQREGVGTTLVCHTRVGPLHLADELVVTSWIPEAEMGISHNGVVTGRGVFELRALGADRTAFRWREELRFPWWLGGPLIGACATPVLRAIWRANLRRLAARLTGA